LLIITRDVDFVPPVPVAALHPPLEIINEVEEADSGVALKPSKADSHQNPLPPAESNRSQENEESLDSITVKASAPSTAVDDEATREVVGASRRPSLQKNAGLFSTPRFHNEQSRSERT
jgi:hypothetical protein